MIWLEFGLIAVLAGGALRLAVLAARAGAAVQHMQASLLQAQDRWHEAVLEGRAEREMILTALERVAALSAAADRAGEATSSFPLPASWSPRQMERFMAAVAGLMAVEVEQDWPPRPGRPA